MKVLRLIFLVVIFVNFACASLTKEQMQKFIIPPMELGAKDDAIPIWNILNSGGDLVGYIFESKDFSPATGFSGGEMNLLISIDLEGNFIDVLVLEQSEPVFVGGLGVIPFNEFLMQYRGKSLASNIKVSSANSKGSGVQIDGVTKATASVIIANDAIIASAIKVAKEKLAGIAPKEVSYPNKEIYEKLSFEELLKKGLVKNFKIKNKEVEKLFLGSSFEGSDEIALEEPEELYMDVYVADLSIPSVSKNLLSQETIKDIEHQLTATEEAIIVFSNGRHQLVSENFVRNSVPNLIELVQDKFPITIKDADLDIDFLENVPETEQAMIFQVNTKFGFDPSSPWELNLKIVRDDGNYLYSAFEERKVSVPMQVDKKYFLLPTKKDDSPMWLNSWKEQKIKLFVITLFLIILFILLYKYKNLLKSLEKKRFLILLFTLFFIGWYGQGQLSMVTVIGFIKSVVNWQSLSFLLFDPFSLIIWIFVLVSLILWGRGTFCGWLCPYGVLQEISYNIGKYFKIKKIKISDKLNKKLILIKYVILALLIFVAIFAPALGDIIIEVEPFKTAITLQFNRSWGYVLYALSWLILSVFIFRAFCRYFCPLGAFLSLLGKLKILNWIPRRKECGTPCQTCNKSCNYNAISKSDGQINYSECFQCLDCVDIYHSENKCSILKLKKRKGK
ncbi:MAG: 4Fe-4S binding protein [Arcobacter sp.]|nr:4Fe-4S binding protein [Arcobacter sp.]